MQTDLDFGRVQDFIDYHNNMFKIKDIDPSIWMMNYLVNRLELNENQILWLCFLYALTYHLPAAYLIINEYPDLELIEETRLRKWWKEVYYEIPFQKDKAKEKKWVPESILTYKELVKGDQKKFFDDILNKSPEENFNLIWNDLYKNINHFGRFSVWNWIQALKSVAGYQIQPNSLLLGNKKESRTHTHGLCYAYGKDEWAKKEVIYENGKKKKLTYTLTKEEIKWLENNSKKLLEAIPHSDPFTIETVACAYKKTFRERESRYVGYYLDRQAEDIRSIQDKFPGVDWDILWQARQECLDKEFINDEVQKEKFKLPYEEKIKIQKQKGVTNDWI